jgi:hypothetical protein
MPAQSAPGSPPEKSSAGSSSPAKATRAADPALSQRPAKERAATEQRPTQRTVGTEAKEDALAHVGVASGCSLADREVVRPLAGLEPRGWLWLGQGWAADRCRPPAVDPLSASRPEQLRSVRGHRLDWHLLRPLDQGDSGTLGASRHPREGHRAIARRPRRSRRSAGDLRSLEGNHPSVDFRDSGWGRSSRRYGDAQGGRIAFPSWPQAAGRCLYPHLSRLR